MTTSQPRRWLALLCLLAAAGSATAQPLATATVADTGSGGGAGGGTFFYALETNGNALESNAARESLRASANRGMNLTVKPYERPVPAGPTKLKLRAAVVNAAPIQTIVSYLWRGGDALEVEGVIEVDLKPGMRYRVNGVLDAFRREVWLEDETGTVLGQRIGTGMTEEQKKAMEGTVYYLCCNQRYEGDWINDANWPHLPVVPAGSRVKLLGFSRNQAQVLIEGRKMRIGNDYGREKETVQELVGQLLLKEDPRPGLASMSAPAREAVPFGRVQPGMSRDEVKIALGRPRLDVNTTLDGPEWTYQLNGGEEVVLVFTGDGKLAEVDGSRKARALLLMPRTPAAAAAPASAASAP